MNTQSYKIIRKRLDGEDTAIFQLVPKDSSSHMSFLPGQYCFIQNPLYSDPTETHPFSIASSPQTKEYLEFCIKKLGDWTTHFVDSSNVGDIVNLSNPQGNFIWDDSIHYAIFLLGGIGISPIMSMLRYLRDTKQTPKLTMLYGNRTPNSVVYKSELTELSKLIPLNIIDIYSHVENDHPWEGYRGFITEEIVKKEVDLGKEPIFFIIGPPIFIEKMNTLLSGLHISPMQIRQEQLEPKSAI